MKNKKTKKESMYRKLFNALIGENCLNNCILLAIGIFIGLLGFSQVNTFPLIEDPIQIQTSVMILLIYLVAYFYIGIKYINGILPLVGYSTLVLMIYGVENAPTYSIWILLSTIFFALVDNVYIKFQRRKKK